MLDKFKRPALVAVLAFTLVTGVSVTPATAETTEIDFGEDSGEFVNDGECDDVRFEGDGATTAGGPGTDASDCRALHEAGDITLRASMNEGLALPDFGDDSGQYANDGDCDDPRFDGLRTTALGAPSMDATDCRALWDLGLLMPRTSVNEGLEAPDFGDDSGDYANDGECDDPRFQGERTTTVGYPLTDATDCEALWDMGLIAPRQSINEGLEAPDFGDNSGDYINDGDCDDPRFEGERTTMLGAPGTDAADCAALWDMGLIAPRTMLNEGLEAPDFGDDSGQYANDSECDDPRFEGPGASSVGTIGTDATDCAAAWAAGTITLAPEIAPEDNPYNIVFDGIVFGDNSSSWANDSECDDPRFAGEGMADILVNDDLSRDATDCLVLYVRGQITLTE